MIARLKGTETGSAEQELNLLDVHNHTPKAGPATGLQSVPNAT